MPGISQSSSVSSGVVEVVAARTTRQKQPVAIIELVTPVSSPLSTASSSEVTVIPSSPLTTSTLSLSLTSSAPSFPASSNVSSIPAVRSPPHGANRCTDLASSAPPSGASGSCCADRCVDRRRHRFPDRSSLAVTIHPRSPTLNAAALLDWKKFTAAGAQQRPSGDATPNDDDDRGVSDDGLRAASAASQPFRPILRRAATWLGLLRSDDDRLHSRANSWLRPHHDHHRRQQQLGERGDGASPVGRDAHVSTGGTLFEPRERILDFAAVTGGCRRSIVSSPSRRINRNMVTPDYTAVSRRTALQPSTTASHLFAAGSPATSSATASWSPISAAPSTSFVQLPASTAVSSLPLSVSTTSVAHPGGTVATLDRRRGSHRTPVPPVAAIRPQLTHSQLTQTVVVGSGTVCRAPRVYRLAIDGVTCLGKSTLLRFLDGKTWHGNPVRSHFLEFSLLREELPEFRGKLGNMYLETMYTVLHLMRSLTGRSTSGATSELHLTDRMPLANLIFDMLFHFEGQRNPRRLERVLREYDLWFGDEATAGAIDPVSSGTTKVAAAAELSVYDRERVRSFDFAFRLFAREMRTLCPDYHVLFLVARNATATATNLQRRDNLAGPQFDVRSYILAQNMLYRRAASLMGPEHCTLLQIGEQFLSLTDVTQLVRRVFPGQQWSLFDGGCSTDDRCEGNVIDERSVLVDVE